MDRRSSVLCVEGIPEECKDTGAKDAAKERANQRSTPDGKERDEARNRSCSKRGTAADPRSVPKPCSLMRVRNKPLEAAEYHSSKRACREGIDKRIGKDERPDNVIGQIAPPTQRHRAQKEDEPKEIADTYPAQ